MWCLFKVHNIIFFTLVHFLDQWFVCLYLLYLFESVWNLPCAHHSLPVSHVRVKYHVSFCKLKYYLQKTNYCRVNNYIVSLLGMTYSLFPIIMLDNSCFFRGHYLDYNIWLVSFWIKFLFVIFPHFSLFLKWKTRHIIRIFQLYRRLGGYGASYNWSRF